MNTIVSHAIAVIIGGAVVTGICAYNTLTKTFTPSIIAQPSKEVEKVVWKARACPGIKVAPDETRKKLGVPDAVQGDVVAAVKIPGDDRSHTITGVYSSETMAVTLLDRRDSLPWLSVVPKYSLGLYYGANDKDMGVYRLTGGFRAFKVKLIDFGVTGSIETGGRYFIGVGGQIVF